MHFKCMAAMYSLYSVRKIEIGQIEYRLYIAAMHLKCMAVLRLKTVVPNDNHSCRAHPFPKWLNGGSSHPRAGK